MSDAVLIGVGEMLFPRQRRPTFISFPLQRCDSVHYAGGFNPSNTQLISTVALNANIKISRIPVVVADNRSMPMAACNAPNFVLRSRPGTKHSRQGMFRQKEHSVKLVTQFQLNTPGKSSC